MLDRTWNRVGHGREREVGDGRRGKREQTGKVSTYGRERAVGGQEKGNKKR